MTDDTIKATVSNINGEPNPINMYLPQTLKMPSLERDSENLSETIIPTPTPTPKQNTQDDLSIKTKELIEKINKLKSEITNRRDNKLTNINNLKLQLQNTITKLNEIKNVSMNSETELKDKELQLQKLLQEKNDAHNQVDILNKRVTDLTGKVNKLQLKATEYNEFEQEKQQLKAREQELMNEINNKMKEINKLKQNKNIDKTEFNKQLTHLTNISSQLEALDNQVKTQGSQIDQSFDEFNRQSTSSMGLIDDLDQTVRNVGTMIGNIFLPMQGGSKSSKKKLKSPRYHKRSRKTLENIAKKYGIKNVKKYRNKNELIAAITLIIIYKMKGKNFSKKDLITVSQNLDIKVDSKTLKKDLLKKIDYKTRKFSVKELY